MQLNVEDLNFSPDHLGSPLRETDFLFHLREVQGLHRHELGLLLGSLPLQMQLTFHFGKQGNLLCKLVDTIVATFQTELLNFLGDKRSDLCNMLLEGVIHLAEVAPNCLKGWIVRVSG